MFKPGKFFSPAEAALVNLVIERDLRRYSQDLMLRGVRAVATQPTMDTEPKQQGADNEHGPDA